MVRSAANELDEAARTAAALEGPLPARAERVTQQLEERSRLDATLKRVGGTLGQLQVRVYA